MILAVRVESALNRPLALDVISADRLAIVLDSNVVLCYVHGHSRGQYRGSFVCGSGGRRGRAESADFLAERGKRNPRGPQHPRRGPWPDGPAAASFSTPGSLRYSALLDDASKFRTLRYR